MTSPSLAVLIVSGDSLMAGSLEHLLSAETRVQRATTLASASATLAAQPIDTVVIDLAMIDGTELCDLARVGQATRPTLFGLLRQDCALRTVEALQAGAQECLVFSDLSTERLIRSLRQGIERQRVQQRLADLALRDELTGLYNRRGFFAIGEHLRRECFRHARDLAIVQVDLDGLKAINDSFGHAAGDQAIAATAAILRSTFRESDVVARLGGDEFVAITLDADRVAVGRIVARLEDGLVQHNLRSNASFALSFSAGSSVLTPPDRTTLNDLLDRADRALYVNKRHRRQAAWVANLASTDLRSGIAA
jgi:two-component system, cell cycle response regulator